MASADVLSFDALIADVGKLNDTLNFKDLQSVLSEVFTGEQNDFSLKTRRDFLNHSVKGKPYCTFSVFIVWFFFIAGVASCLLIYIPYASHSTIEFVGNVLHVETSHLLTLQNDMRGGSLKALRKTAAFFRLQGFLSVTDLSFDECFIENPLQADVIECDYFEGIEEPLYISESFQKKGEWMEHPVLNFQGRGMECDLKQLQMLLLKSSLMVNSDTVSVSSSNSKIKTVEDLVKTEMFGQVLKDAGIHIVGTSLSYLSSHMLKPASPNLRTLFENTVSGSYKSIFYIDGSNSPSYKLQPAYKGRDYYCIYSQASGSRRLVFSPAPHCASKANSFTFVVQPKDVVTYLKEAWDVHSEPLDDDTLSPSIGFLSEFEPIE